MPAGLEAGGLDLGSLGAGWHKVLEPVPPNAAILLPLKKNCRLQSCRFGGLDAWMPGCQEAWRLEAWILELWRLVGLPAG